VVSVLPEKRLTHLVWHFVLRIFHVRLKACLSIGMDLGQSLSLAWRCLRPEERVGLLIRVVHVSVVVIVVSVLPQKCLLQLVWYLILNVLDVRLKSSLLVGLDSSQRLWSSPLCPEERVRFDGWVVHISVIVIIMGILPEKSLLELVWHFILNILHVRLEPGLLVWLNCCKRLRSSLSRCPLRPEEGVGQLVRVVDITIVVIVMCVLPQKSFLELMWYLILNVLDV
jgi:hypothetical protein